jgi:thiosulfate dehydrogenase
MSDAMRDRLFLGLVAALALACGGPPEPARGGTADTARRGPPDSLIPDGPLGAAIRRGRALLAATRDSLPALVGNKLRCVSCHLDDGRRESGSWIGTFARYPQYRARSARVETLEYRVNDCFRRSMNGTPLATDGPDMRDIVAYLWFLSRGVAVAPPGPSTRLAKWAAFTADTAAGGRVYGAVCATCHGPDGDGTAVAPPVWGPASYNIGAGLTRVRTAAAFIHDNMPFDQPGTLTDQQAFDVAAYVNAHPRPDYPDKVNDWPRGWGRRRRAARPRAAPRQRPSGPVPGHLP